MNDTKKIELALQDLVAGIEARAKNQRMFLSERIEQLAGQTSDLFERIESRLERLENAADGMFEIEVRESIATSADELQAAHLRIADLERDLGNANGRISVLENEQAQMQNQVTAAHRRIDELKYSDHRRIADLEKRTDDLENDGLDNVRTIVADMINDGDIRLHVD